MKKVFILVLLAFMVKVPFCFAITPEEARSDLYLRRHGYSRETARLVDLNDSQINGTVSSFKSNDPEWYQTDKRVRYIRKFFMYIDPGLDDQNQPFGQDNINFSNRWDNI